MFVFVFLHLSFSKINKGDLFMAWIYLTLACIFEICFSVGLKYTQGFTLKMKESLGTLVPR